MSDVRDPERDQPLPLPGNLPVQDIMIAAIEERRDHGIRKYGRPLETNNGRDALKDAWEEVVDLFAYLTQMRLERGDVLPGMEGVFGAASGERCPGCKHEPHASGQCASTALPMRMPCSCA